jgi:hypothetical protein
MLISGALPHVTSASPAAYNEEEMPESERRTSRPGGARCDHLSLKKVECKLVAQADFR